MTLAAHLSELSPAEKKACALLLVLSEEERRRVLEHLGDEVRTRCLDLLNRTRNLPAKDLIQLAIEELQTVLESPNFAGHVHEGNDSANHKADSSPASETNDSTLPVAENEPTEEPNSFTPDALRTVDPRKLAAALQHESPRLAAGILSTLPPETAAAVLAQLPDGESVFLALLNPPNIPPRTLASLGKKLLDRLEQPNAQTEASGPDQRLEKTLALVRRLPPGARNAFLARLKETDPEFAEQVYENLYVFDDLLRVADSCIQKILGELELRTVAMALSGASPELKTKIASNLSKRVRESLFEELEMLGAVPPTKVEAARREFLKKLLELDQKGELVMETS